MVRVGLALGGGGTRGPAHAGVLRVLRTHPQIMPSIVAGTSAGSIAASLYAIGVSQEQTEGAFIDFDWFRDVINIPATIRSFFDGAAAGLISNANLRDSIARYADGRGFNELGIDLAVTAVELETRRRVIFTNHRMARKLQTEHLEQFLPSPTDDKPGAETIVISDYGDIGEAVRASCAIPGFFQPVTIRGMRLLDGGVVDQVPVDVVRAMGAEVTVAVSLGMSYHHGRLAHPSDALTEMIGLMAVQQLRRSLDMADVGFQLPGIEDRSMLKANQSDLMDLGEEEMRKRVDRLLALTGKRRFRRTRKA